MSRTPNWATFQAKRKARERGTEDATGTMEHPGKALLEAATAGRNKRLRLYLETGPSGERDVEPLLDRMKVPVRTPFGAQYVPRATRDTWLREVLDACED